MNCTNCNHPQSEHRTRGCYHVIELQSANGAVYCPCELSDKDIEIASLQSENARLRAALEMYADPDNWGTGLARPSCRDIWMSQYDGYIVAQATLKDQAE